jgi:Zn-dependent protease
VLTMDFAQIGQVLSVWFLPVIIAITFHEAAHGWMAEYCGDNTARMLGRVTFNPIKHVDPFGTLLLPGMLLFAGAPILFGYAKPVPVNFARLDNPKRDMIWVAIAGPGINLILAVICALLIHVATWLPANVGQWVLMNLANAVLINIVLALFNMLPIPPLDGGRVLTGLLPHSLAWRFAKVERYGILILLVLLLVIPWVSEQFGAAFHPLFLILSPLISGTFNTLIDYTGIVQILIAWYPDLLILMGWR